MRIFLSISILIISFLLFLNIFQVFSFAQKFYLVNNYQTQINRTSKEVENLEVSLSKSASLSNIENYISGGGFVKAAKPKYIPILETSVAAKQPAR